ncbi:hypothetical protein PMAYCL1PPCAC_27232, partial [Pristionchus mayeri]
LSLLLLGSVSSDRLRFHLEYLIDRNVSACDDFYHHVCSQSVDPNEFFINQVKDLFVNATHRLRPNAMKNNPIAVRNLTIFKRNRHVLSISVRLRTCKR